MKLNTKHFGELEIEEDKIIIFPKGIPGFIEYTQYAIINDEEADSPFCWLQSVEEPNLAFTLVNPFLIYPDYKPNLSEIEVAKLGQGEPEDYSILSIALIPEDVEKMTANLMAPIVINLKSKKAMQIIQDGEEYPVKYYLFKELQKMAK